jgi:hypothetical protein
MDREMLVIASARVPEKTGARLSTAAGWRNARRKKRTGNRSYNRYFFESSYSEKRRFPTAGAALYR